MIIKCNDCQKETTEGDLQGLCIMCSADHLVLMAEAEVAALEALYFDIDMDMELESTLNRERH